MLLQNSKRWYRAIADNTKHSKGRELLFCEVAHGPGNCKSLETGFYCQSRLSTENTFAFTRSWLSSHWMTWGQQKQMMRFGAKFCFSYLEPTDRNLKMVTAATEMGTSCCTMKTLWGRIKAVMKQASVTCWVFVSSKLQRPVIKTFPFTYDSFREKKVQKLPAIWDSGMIYQRQIGS